jgi:hypothetical protein
MRLLGMSTLEMVLHLAEIVHSATEGYPCKPPKNSTSKLVVILQ